MHIHYRICFDNWERRYLISNHLGKSYVTLKILPVFFYDLEKISLLFQLAVMGNATGIIVSHNHPSGTFIPSEEDKKLTQNIKMGCRYFDIDLIDHVIYTTTGYYSFCYEGAL